MRKSFLTNQYNFQLIKLNKSEYNMKELVTTKMFRELNQQDRGVLYRNKNSDSLSSRWFIKNFTKKDIEQSLKEFNRNSGSVNDGFEITIESESPFFKIFTDLKLPNAYRKQKTVHNLTTLLEAEARAFTVFINGKKIPDDVIKVYVTQNGTDVFIPYKYVNIDKEFNVFIEDVLLRDKEYIHTYIKSNNSNTFIIDLNGKDNYFDYDNFNKDKLMIYNDGFLTSENFSATCSKANKNITITANNSVNKEVEVFYDHFVSFKKVQTGTFTGTKFTFTIDKEYQNLLYGPISEFACLLYRNGLRCSYNEIKQISRKMFQIEFEESMNFSNLMIYVQDINSENDRFKISYNSDYYFEKMLGSEKILKGLDGIPTGTAFDRFPEIDYHKIFNDNGMRYSETLADSYIYDSTIGTAADKNYVNLLKKLIDRNPSIMRELLKKFGRTIVNYIVNKRESDYIITSKNIVNDDQEIEFDVFVNYNHLSRDSYTIKRVNNLYNVILPFKYLDQEFNFIEVNEKVIPKNFNKLKYLEYDPSNISLPDNKECLGTLVIPKKIVEEYTDKKENIIILEKIIDESGYIYPDKNYKNGYKSIKDFEIDITESNYRINFKTLPKKDFLVYFTNFSNTGRLIYDKAGEDDNSRLFIYMGSLDNPIPIINNSIPELYVNDKYFIYGIDYTYSTPLNNDIMSCSVISFNRPVYEGDIIVYSFDGLNNKSILKNYKTNFEHHSKFGLLYLSGLEFPFYPDYFDLYIDGRKVFKTDIDILSDKLLRIRNIPVPFRDIHLETKFLHDYDDLQFLFDLYKEDEWELVVEKMFKSVDPTDPNPDIDDRFDPDDIYENEFEDDVGENPFYPVIPGLPDTGGSKDQNPENPEKPIERQNYLLTMYLRWLTSNDARTIVFNDIELDKRVYDNFKVYQTSSVNTDIIIDCTQAIIQDKQDYHINGDMPNISMSDRMNIILKELRETGKSDFTFNEIFDKFINNPVSNRILPLDFPWRKDKTGNLINLTSDIHYCPENEDDWLIVSEEKEQVDLKVTYTEKKVILTNEIYLFIYSSGDYVYEQNNDNIIIEKIQDEEIGDYLKITGYKTGESIITVRATKDGFLESVKEVKIIIVEKGYLSVNENNISLFNGETKDIEINTNFNSISVDYNSEILDIGIVELDNNILHINTVSVGEDIITITGKNDMGESITVTINVNVIPKPMTLLQANMNSIELYNTDSPISVKINTSATEFDYEITQSDNFISIEKTGMSLNISPLKEGNGNIRIFATAENSLPAEINIDFLIKTKETSILEINQEDFELIEGESINIPVITENNQYELTIRPEDSFTADYQDNSVDLTSLKPCSGLLLFKAEVRDKLPNTKTINFNILEKASTQLSANTASIVLTANQESIIEVYTNALNIEANIVNNSIVDFEINNTNITIRGKSQGETILRISATAENCKQNTIEIPITIQEGE